MSFGVDSPISSSWSTIQGTPWEPTNSLVANVRSASSEVNRIHFLLAARARANESGRERVGSVSPIGYGAAYLGPIKLLYPKSEIEKGLTKAGASSDARQSISVEEVGNSELVPQAEALLKESTTFEVYKHGSVNNHNIHRLNSRSHRESSSDTDISKSSEAFDSEIAPSASARRHSRSKRPNGSISRSRGSLYGGSRHPSSLNMSKSPPH